MPFSCELFSVVHVSNKSTLKSRKPDIHDLSCASSTRLSNCTDHALTFYRCVERTIKIYFQEVFFRKDYSGLVRNCFAFSAS